MSIPRLLIRWTHSWRFHLTALVALIVGTYMVENWRGERAWASAQARLRAAGEPVAIADWLPIPPPEDRNFAMNPVFVRRFGFGRPSPHKADPWEWPPGAHSGHHPPDGFPYEAIGGHDGSSKTNLPLLAASLPPPFAPDAPITDSNAAQAILRWSQQWEDDFVTLRTAARERPDNWVPIGDNTPQALASHHERLDGWLDGARLLQLRALAQTEAHDSGGALDSIAVSLRMAQSTAAEPCRLTGVTLSAAVAALQLAVINHGLRLRIWSAPDSQQLDAQLAGVQCLSDYRRALRGERLFTNALIDARMVQTAKTPIDWGGPWDPWFMRVAPRGAWRHNQAKSADWQLAQQSRLQKEFFERPFLHTPDHRASWRTPYSWVFTIMVVGTKGLETTFDEVDGAFRLARLAVALERHFLAHDKYPDSLAGLDAPDAARLMRDPYTGQTVHFTLVHGRPKLWLSGPNQRDDGGANEAMGGDDIVWGYPAP